MKNVFNETDAAAIIGRINNLTPETHPIWGTMNVAQMLAHCNVTYEMAFEDKHAKPNPVIKFILKLLVKPTVVNEIPYKRNGKTAPAFIIKDTRKYAILILNN